MRKCEPAFTSSEGDLNSWGNGLIERENGKAAMEIFKLGTVLYPDSANVFDNLGDGYEKTKQKLLAIAAYKRALSLDPAARQATARLKALAAQ